MSNSNWREIAVGAIVPVIVVALWQACASFGWINPRCCLRRWR
jgi:NitT/TauT family transport system permease protein